MTLVGNFVNSFLNLELFAANMKITMSCNQYAKFLRQIAKLWFSYELVLESIGSQGQKPNKQSNKQSNPPKPKQQQSQAEF